MLGQFDTPRTWSDEEAWSRLGEKYGEDDEDVVRLFQEAYPDKSVADAYYIDSSVIRVPMLKIMNAKADSGDAPVYAYVFSWGSDVMNGVFSSYHTSEIPFVFYNIDKADSTTGGGEDAWEPYTREGGATIVFDNDVRLVHHHDAELIRLLSGYEA